MRESDIEKYLVEQVFIAGGLCRKVQWVGHNSAPDRVVMMPGASRFGALPPRLFWVELKAPGLAATFPANAHERAQAREHERMRKAGQVVVVVDSREGVDDLLA